MSEHLEHHEGPIGKQWEIYGTKIGPKSQNLIDFDAIKPHGIRVQRGVCIGASYSDELDVHYDDPEGEMVITLPEFLHALNKKLAARFVPRQPMAVRSSGLSEDGPSGKYMSVFIVPTGDIDTDIALLEKAEMLVYESYCFAATDEDHEEHSEVEDGMGILIQPVVGEEIDGFFAPVFAGVMTHIDDEPLLRFTCGLGTEAVNHTNNAFTLKRDEATFRRVLALVEQLREDSISMYSGAIDCNNSEVPMVTIIGVMTEHLLKYLQRNKSMRRIINLWNDKAAEGNPYYFEFALDPHSHEAVIVQASPETLTPTIPELGPRQGILLCEGTDVVYSGEKKGRGILWIGRGRGYDARDLEQISSLNKGSSNFLVIVPERALSQGTEKKHRLTKTHFYRAAGVVELQTSNPHELRGMTHLGKGGTHLSKICEGIEVLYLGVEDFFDNDIMKTLLDQNGVQRGSFSSYYDVDFVISTAKTGGRVELLSRVRPMSRKDAPFFGLEEEY